MSTTEQEGERLAVLASGGVDSAVLVARSTDRFRSVHPLYVRFGLAWEAVEEAHLRRFLATLPDGSVQPLVTLDFPIGDVYGDHWSTSGRDVPDARSDDDAVYLPGRNVLLLAKASVWCALHGIEAIALGTLKGNPFPDSSRAFFDGYGALAGGAMSTRLEVLTPFAASTKADVLELGRGLQLHTTFSCIDPRGGLHCGRCNKCAERRRAFDQLGTDDRTPYSAR